MSGFLPGQLEPMGGFLPGQLERNGARRPC